jgi:hypothetical protein
LMRRHNISSLFDATLSRRSLAIAEFRKGISEESLWLS